MAIFTLIGMAMSFQTAGLGQVQAVKAMTPGVIWAQMEKREAKLQSLALKFEAVQFLYSLKHPARNLIAGTCTYDSKGRTLNENASVHDSVGQQRVNVSIARGSYDGKRTLKLSGANGKLTFFRISNDRLVGIDGEHPRHFVSPMKYDERANKGPEKSGDVVQRTSWNGRSVFAIASVPFEPKGYTIQFQGRALVEPERGYLVVRYSKWSRPDRNAEWSELHAKEVIDQIEASPGIWLPTRVNAISYNAPSKERGPEVFLKMEWKASNLRVNVSIPDNAFEIDLPSGTTVQDEIGKKNYSIPQVRNSPIQVDMETIKTLAERVEEMQKETPMPSVTPSRLNPK